MAERRGIAGQALYRAIAAGDHAAVRALQAAIYAPEIASRCDALARERSGSLALVAEIDGTIIGHVLLVPIEGPERALALAPHAVLAAWRDMQVGTELLRHALGAARASGWRSVFVFGQPGYYGRFGFTSRAADAAEVPCQGPRFLALELIDTALSGWAGPIAYPDTFLAMAGAARA
ncbi:GNAT family N-acetyltransferase [Hoeflea olei]|uniref:N-acetyltransferase domain-containing protein n=1 Tax=Hoeflea olei TaxID=1480615 RepID=A0A1C1YZZ4_9HYPH|nr:N-acetyltransferase [Hoeflea olei]OCW59047.1 hypothetical protein AWJ14_04910 [Hoeflea olei]